MGVCVHAAGELLLSIASSAFTLGWVHSVEKTEWIETWQVHPSSFLSTEVRIKGSGAGIDPAPNAVLQDGWYVWKPEPALRVPKLNLIASGQTPSAWQLCPAGANTGQCVHIDMEGANSNLDSTPRNASKLTLNPEQAQHIELRPCPVH